MERGDRTLGRLGAVVDRPVAYAGKQVEVSIAYASDWSVQGLGAFVDDTTVSTGATTSFEDDLGGWTVTGPPAGSGPNSNNWTRTTAAGFPEGAAIIDAVVDLHRASASRASRRRPRATRWSAAP